MHASYLATNYSKSYCIHRDAPFGWVSERTFDSWFFIRLIKSRMTCFTWTKHPGRFPGGRRRHFFQVLTADATPFFCCISPCCERKRHRSTCSYCTNWIQCFVVLLIHRETKPLNQKEKSVTGTHKREICGIPLENPSLCDSYKDARAS
jgi:hypothetical protein